MSLGRQGENQGLEKRLETDQTCADLRKTLRNKATWVRVIFFKKV